MEYFDKIGNEIKVGDEVLILVPKTDATYRQGIIKDLKDERSLNSYFCCEVLVEYDDGRLYCDKKYYQQYRGGEIRFKTKLTKVWRSNNDIIKFKPEYLS